MRRPSESASYPRGKAEALRTAGYALSVLDDMEGGFAKMRRALEVIDLPDVHEPDVAATIHDILANLYFFVGMYAESFEHSRVGIEYAEQAGHTRVEAYCLRNLGLLYSMQRDYGRARELFSQARKLFERIEYRIGVAWTLYHTGEIELAEGRPESAIEYFRSVLNAVSEQEFATLYASGRKGLAETLWRLGRLEEARECVDAASQAPRQFARIRADTELIRGHVYADMGRREEALSVLEETAGLAAETGSSRVEADAHELRARLLAEDGDLQAAYEEQRRASRALSDLLAADSERDLRNTELRYSLEAVRREEEERRLADLRRMNEELEERVRQRTRDLEEERARLEDANRRLARISSEREDLVRILSHDLRNPLSAISQMLQLLDRSEEEAVYVDTIRRSAETGLGIIDAVKQMLAVESGKKKLELEPVNIRSAVEAATAPVRRRFADKGLEIENRVEEACVALADYATFVNSVLANLLTNAAKFSEAGGAITIDADAAESEVQILIRDHGLGIPKEVLASIFDPFSPTTREGTRGETGTGFGMPLTRRLVDRYGGTIELSSSTSGDDRGTTVIITLPRG